MNRPIMRLVAAVLGGIAVVTVLGALVIAVSSGRGLVPAGAGWVVPLVVGGSVGLLSWFLLTETPSEDGSDAKRATVTCALCGTEVLEDWRLCPYCGELNESPRPGADAAGVASQIEG